MAEENPWREKSDAELIRQQELIAMALAARGAKRKVAMAHAFRIAFMELQKSGDLGSKFEDINHQALPRPGLLGKPAGLSETEVANLEQAVKDALEKAAKG